MSIESVSAHLQLKYANEPEFLQAVQEVLHSIAEVYSNNPRFAKNGVLERLVEPDRVLQFKVPWIDDAGVVHVNTGYRVQFNNAIGPYKGGLRFHPSVNLSILKFLAFEQIFKNSLTTLPMGSAKGGSDFDPKGKSDNEVMRFCQSFMLELWRVIGSDMDVPAGDIGVGAREIGYLFGMHKKLTHEHTGVLTGKGINWGGSRIRPEATGFGVVYFANQMLSTRKDSMAGKKVAVSGFGNVAWGTVQKATELGAKVITLSGPDGYVYDPAGVSGDKIEFMLALRASNQDIIEPYSKRFGVEFFKGRRPWEVPCDVAIPCATQNELHEADAQMLIKNGCICVCEAANMPCTHEAVNLIQKHGLLYSPGKASNAGGVAVSGLEMSQNSVRYTWAAQGVDDKLRRIMIEIHDTCVQHGTQADGYIDYVKGANIAGFLKVAGAMLDMGVI